MVRVFNCPKCGRSLNITGRKAGEIVKCEYCRAPARVIKLGEELSEISPPVTPRTSTMTEPRGTTFLLYASLVTSLCAIVMSSVAMFSIPGGNLDDYDFSTPRAALESKNQMIADGDWASIIELRVDILQKESEEFLDTLEVRKYATAGSAKILFISFEEGGVKKYQTRAFEKDADTGKWAIADSEWTSAASAELVAQIKTWRSKGEL